MGEQRRRNQVEAVSQESDDIDRKLWVVAVIAFWISAAITLAAMLITGKLNLILLSITFGLMVLGVWLKTRYQLQQRKRNTPKTDDDAG